MGQSFFPGRVKAHATGSRIRRRAKTFSTKQKRDDKRDSMYRAAILQSSRDGRSFLNPGFFFGLAWPPGSFLEFPPQILTWQAWSDSPGSWSNQPRPADKVSVPFRWQAELLHPVQKPYMKVSKMPFGRERGAPRPWTNGSAEPY